MRKFLITVGLMLLTIPALAQENIPTIVIPQAEAAPFTVERIESAGYHINTSADGTFRIWIGREGFQLVYADMIAANGVIDLPTNNIWLGNGNYTFWVCPGSCEYLESWLGPVELAVNEARQTNLAQLEVHCEPKRTPVDISWGNPIIQWQNSDLLSWYHLWVGRFGVADVLEEILIDEWRQCDLDMCRIEDFVMYQGETNGRTDVYIQGWGAGGLTSEWSYVQMNWCD